LADLDAGSFATWRRGLQAALRGEADSNVPCDGCTACCTAAQFIHIGPEELDTLANVPAELLFAAPRLPKGHVLLGYDERGHCPMLKDGACSIYEHRPRTCRTYDCRVFAATGVTLEPSPDKAGIARRAAQWHFWLRTETDRAEATAARGATSFLAAHPEVMTDDATPPTSTEHALAALSLVDLFVEQPVPTPDAVRVNLRMSVNR
jgi:Fe-S-cluster containining protein